MKTLNKHWIAKIFWRLRQEIWPWSKTMYIHSICLLKNFIAWNSSTLLKGWSIFSPTVIHLYQLKLKKETKQRVGKTPMIIGWQLKSFITFSPELVTHSRNDTTSIGKKILMENNQKDDFYIWKTNENHTINWSNSALLDYSKSEKACSNDNITMCIST